MAQYRTIAERIALDVAVQYQEVLRQFDFTAQYTAIAEKMALDLAPVLRQVEMGEQLRKSLEDSFGGYAKVAQETVRRMEEMYAGLNVRLPEFPAFVPRYDLLSYKAEAFAPGPEPEPKLWYGREPGSPKRSIGFIDTNGM